MAMTKEQVDALLAMIQSLLAMAKPEPEPEKAPEVTTNRPGNVPPQFYVGPVVTVRPTGVRAVGVVREWPVPLAGLNQLGYMQWLCGLLRPDGLSYVPEQYRATVSTAISSAGYGRPFGPEEYPWRADAWVYPEDWQTQAQIDQHERDVAGWSPWNAAKQRGDDAPAADGTV